MSGRSGVAAVRAAVDHLDSTNPVSIQESIDKLDHFQTQARIHLFRLLQRLATQPGEALGQALSQLAAQADKVIVDSPEASILPHISTYQEIVSRIRELTAEISRKRAAEDVETQVQEFEDRLAAGGLSDAAYCVVRLEKMAQDAEEELAEREARQQQQGQGAGGDEAAAAASGPGEAAAGPEGSGGSAAPAGGSSRVSAESVALLRETAERCSTQLKEVLEACCEEAVVVESTPSTSASSPSLTGSGDAGAGVAGGGRVVVRSSLRGGAVRVPDLFSALQVLGLQQPHLRRITGRLVSGALKPMLAAPCCVTVTPAAEPGAPASLTWQPAPPAAGRPSRHRGSAGGAGGGGAVAACDPEHCCQHLLRLLATWLLEFDEGLMEVLGGPFWRAAADCYISLVARPFIASNPEDVEGCEAMVAAAADLEAMAESLSFTDGEDPYLAPAVESLARHALSSRQEKYLERARQLLVGAPGGGGGAGGGGGSGWDTVVAGQALAVDSEYYRRLAAGELQEWEVGDPPSGLRDDGSLLAAGRYRITQRTNELVQLLTGVLQDACGGSRALARALLNAAGGIALMARTLPPMAAAATAAAGPTPSCSSGGCDPLSSVPQLGLLAVNDLQHLADMMLLLSQAYGGALETATGEPAAPVLVGEALQLRAAARARMRDVLRSQYDDMDEILVGLDKLRTVGGSDSKVGLRHRRVVQQLLHSLGRLGRTAGEVLTPEDGVALGAAVANHVAGQLVAAVMAKGDIAHDECVELGELLSPLVEGAVEVWLGAARAAGPDLSGIPLDVVASALSARASQLRKLRAVLQVLGSDTISHIEQLWERGELALLAPPELEHLLLAISEDSPGRRAMLQKLQ